MNISVKQRSPLKRAQSAPPGGRSVHQKKDIWDQVKLHSSLYPAIMTLFV